MSDIPQIPEALRETLRLSRARIRRILLVRGVLTTLAVFVACVLGVMAIDAMVTIYSASVRWLLWAAAFGGTGAVAYGAVVRPLRRKFSLAEIAALIERNHPELEERLSTVVELAGTPGEDVGSRELIAAITTAALADIRRVSPQKEFTTRTVKPRLVAAGAVLLVLAALFAAFPGATTRLVTRALVPSAEVDNIYASSLKVAPGDKVVLAGSSVEINLAVEGGFPSRAFVRTSVGGRDEAVERMTRTTAEEDAGPAYYTFVYPAVAESFSYRVNCGSALTRAYRVEVVPEPSYTNRSITITHPAYTGRAPDTYTNSADVVGLVGSKVTIRATPSRPDVTGEVELPGQLIVPARTPDLTFAFDLTEKVEGTWRSRVRDSHGFSNLVETASIRVVKDAPPTVKIVVPEERTVKLPRSAVLPITIEASDDFAIAKRTLEICVGAGEWTDLKEMEEDEIRLPLVTLPLGSAAAFRVRVKVEDNRPPELDGPGVTRSEEVLVEIKSSRESGGASLDQQDLKEEIEEAKKDENDIRQHLEKARNCMNNAGNIEKGGWHTENALRQLGWAKGEIAQAEQGLSDFIDDLRLSRLATGVEIFTDVQERHVVPARQQIEDVYLYVSVKEQAKAIQLARKATEAAYWAFNEAMRKFGILTKTAEDLQKLADLAEREEALEDAAEEKTLTDEELQAAREELKKELDQELRDDINKNLDSEIKQAERLAQTAENLAKKQEDIKQQGDGEAQKQAEQKLAEQIQQLANQMSDLKNAIENKAGIPEMDEQKTSEPARNAQRDAQNAANQAREAKKDLQNGEKSSAEAKMDAVQEALKKAQEELSAAKGKLEAKNAELKANAEKLKGDKSAAEALEDLKDMLGEKAQQLGEKPQQQSGEKAQQSGKKSQQQNAKAQQQQSDDPSDSPSDDESSKGSKKPNDQKKPKGAKGKIAGELEPNRGEDWFRMKSDSASGADRDRYEDVPAEYRELVKEYFKAINAGGDR